MGIISRDELKAGDHIYSWRNVYLYSHHGIYIGDEKVIHFIGGGGQKTGTRTFLDKITSRSVPNHGGNHKQPCPNCGDQSNLDGVVSSCLDCFLAGGNIHLFEYSVSQVVFLAKPRRGTCTTAPSDPCDVVFYRAKILLLLNGFGAYHVLENNCEDFAIYCKTSLMVGKNDVFGRGGQAHLVSVVGFITQLFMPSASRALSLTADIGVRKDAMKVSVETLVARSKKT
ncbi:Protein LEAD-SENSITIVE 1 [Cardamine amara subsp. amara]|uniref:Protein LEAD-SENSITIVE 1 n=1 Tax=Cardamine amara subsp. amara TaxID=228776 RepID=A0ABD1BLL0_CARAN